MSKEDEETMLETMRALELPDARHRGEIAPGVHAYGTVRPMGRIRSYTSAGLAPFAGRGLQQEMHLIGHVHLDADGRATAVEGFNGQEGERWAKQAFDKLAAKGLLAEGAIVRPATPLKLCAFTGFR